jgi:hypothetical protein
VSTAPSFGVANSFTVIVNSTSAPACVFFSIELSISRSDSCVSPLFNTKLNHSEEEELRRTAPAAHGTLFTCVR